MARSVKNERWTLPMIKAGIVGYMKFSKGEKGTYNYGYDSLNIGVYFLNLIYNMHVDGEGDKKTVTWSLKSLMELESGLKSLLKDAGDVEKMNADDGFNYSMLHLNSRLSTDDTIRSLLNYSAQVAGRGESKASNIDKMTIKVGSFTRVDNKADEYLIRVNDEKQVFDVEFGDNLILINSEGLTSEVLSIRNKIIRLLVKLPSTKKGETAKPFTKVGDDLTLKSVKGAIKLKTNNTKFQITESEYLEIFEDILIEAWKNDSFNGIANKGRDVIDNKITKYLDMTQDSYSNEYEKIEVAIRYTVDFVEKEINKILAMRPWVTATETGKKYEENRPNVIVPGIEHDSYNYTYENKHQNLVQQYQYLTNANYVPNTYLKSSKYEDERDFVEEKRNEDTKFDDLTVLLVPLKDNDKNIEQIVGNQRFAIVNSKNGKRVERIAKHILSIKVDPNTHEIKIEIYYGKPGQSGNKLVQTIYTGKELAKTINKEGNEEYILKYHNDDHSGSNVNDIDAKFREIEDTLGFNINRRLAKTLWSSNPIEGFQTFLNEIKKSLAEFRALSKKFTPEFLRAEFGDKFYDANIKNSLEIGKADSASKETKEWGPTTFTYDKMMKLEEDIMSFKSANINSKDPAIQNKIIQDAATLILYKIQHVDFVYRWYHIVDLLTDFILYLYPIMDENRKLSSEAPFIPLIGDAGGNKLANDKVIKITYAEARKKILENPKIINTILKTLNLESITPRMESLITQYGKKLNIFNAFLESTEKSSLKSIVNDIKKAIKNKDEWYLQSIRNMYVKGKDLKKDSSADLINSLLEYGDEYIKNEFNVYTKYKESDLTKLINDLNKKGSEKFKQAILDQKNQVSIYSAIRRYVTDHDIEGLTKLYNNENEEIDISLYPDIKREILDVISKLQPKHSLQANADFLKGVLDLFNNILDLDGVISNSTYNGLKAALVNKNLEKDFKDMIKNILDIKDADEKAKIDGEILVEYITAIEKHLDTINSHIDKYIKSDEFEFKQKADKASLLSKYNDQIEANKKMGTEYSSQAANNKIGERLFNQINDMIKYGTTKISEDERRGLITRLQRLVDEHSEYPLLKSIVDDAVEFITNNEDRGIDEDRFIIEFNLEKKLTAKILEDLSAFDLENNRNLLADIQKAIENESINDLTRFKGEVKTERLKKLIKEAITFVKKLTLDSNADEEEDLNIEDLFNSIKDNGSILKLANALYPQDLKDPNSTKMTIEKFKENIFNIYVSNGKSKIDDLVNRFENRLDSKTKKELKNASTILYTVQDAINSVTNTSGELVSDIINTNTNSAELVNYKSSNEEYKNLVKQIELDDISDNSENLIKTRSELLTSSTILDDAKNELIDMINDILNKKKANVDKNLEKYMLENNEYIGLLDKLNKIKTSYDDKEIDTTEFLTSFINFKTDIKKSNLIQSAKDYLLNKIEYLLTQEYKRNNPEYDRVFNDIQKAIANSDFDKLYFLSDDIANTNLHFNVKFELQTLIDEYINTVKKQGGNSVLSKIEKLRNDVKWASDQGHYETIKNWSDSKQYTEFNNVKNLIASNLIKLSKKTSLNDRNIKNIISTLKTGKKDEIEPLLDKYELYPGILDLVHDVLDFIGSKDISDFDFSSYDLEKIKHQMWKKDTTTMKAIGKSRLNTIKHSIKKYIEKLDNKGLESLLNQTSKYPILNKLVRDALLYVLTKQVLPDEYQNELDTFDINKFDKDPALGEPGVEYVDSINYSAVLVPEVLSKIKESITKYVNGTNLAGLESLVKKYNNYPAITNMINDAIEYVRNQVLTKATVNALKKYITAAMTHANKTSLNILSNLRKQYSNYSGIIDMINDAEIYIKSVEGLDQKSMKDVEKLDLGSYKYEDLSTPSKMNQNLKFDANKYSDKDLVISPVTIQSNITSNLDSQSISFIKNSKRVIQDAIETNNLKRLNQLLTDDNIKQYIELVDMIQKGITKISTKIVEDNELKDQIINDADNIELLTSHLNSSKFKSQSNLIAKLLKLNKIIDDNKNDKKLLVGFKTNPEFDYIKIQDKINRYISELDPSLLFANTEIQTIIDKHLTSNDIKEINLLALNRTGSKANEYGMLNHVKKALETGVLPEIELSKVIEDKFRELFKYSNTSLTASGRLLNIKNSVEKLSKMEMPESDDTETPLNTIIEKLDNDMSILEKLLDSITGISKDNLIKSYNDYIGFISTYKNNSRGISILYNLNEEDRVYYEKVTQDLLIELGRTNNELNSITSKTKAESEQAKTSFFNLLDKISKNDDVIKSFHNKISLLINPNMDDDSEGKKQFNKLRLSSKLLNQTITDIFNDNVKKALDQAGNNILKTLVNVSDIRQAILSRAEISKIGDSQASEEKLRSLSKLLEGVGNMVKFEADALGKSGVNIDNIKDIPSKLFNLRKELLDVILDKFKKAPKA